jgi:hypothetical protein
LSPQDLKINFNVQAWVSVQVKQIATQARIGGMMPGRKLSRMFVTFCRNVFHHNHITKISIIELCQYFPVCQITILGSMTDSFI